MLAARLCACFHRTPEMGSGSASALSTMLTDIATTGAHRPRHWFLPSRRPLRLPSPDHLPWLHPQQPQAQPHQVRTAKRKSRQLTDKALTCWTGCSLPSPSRRNELDLKRWERRLEELEGACTIRGRKHGRCKKQGEDDSTGHGRKACA